MAWTLSIFEGFVFRRIDTPIHRLDPRVKFLYTLVMLVLAILFNEFLALFVLFVGQLPLIWVARVQRSWARTMKGSLALVLLIFFTNLLARWAYAGFRLHPVYLEESLAMTLRFLILVESFSIFSLTTSPDDLSLAMEQAGIPYWFCFAFTTSIRLMPAIARDAQTIINAQRSRGLELERGNFLTRIKNYIPILVPLIVTTIRRSLELAEAMESRAWGATEKRTSLTQLEMGKTDYIATVLLLFLLALAIYIRVSTRIPNLTSLIL
ncbi:MAG TPA: energy-coupling factor transporter transmembrane protein EcfT [Candidatus Bathyarchaeota archaeon]|nr:energy-coupling factor transporter transmembrane protein EcfT [Candidatus Bathyarchaeota archaeon]